MKKFIAFVALLLTGVILSGCMTAQAADSFVTIDINPSVAIIINPRDKVIQVESLNEDGDLLLLDLDLVGMDLEVALAILIDTAIGLGFIDPDEEFDIQIDVVSIREQVRARVQARVEARLARALQARELRGTVFPKEYSEEEILEAEELGIEVRELRMLKLAAMREEHKELRELAKEEFRGWMEVVKNEHKEMREVAFAIRDEFLEAREALFEEYKPAIEELNTAIALAIENDEDTTELVAQLEALQAEFAEELAVLRVAFLEAHDAHKAEIEQARAERMEEHRARVEAFRNRMRELGRPFEFEPNPNNNQNPRG